MELDALLRHYLDGDDAEEPGRLAAAGERIALDFGIERDRGRRFALWTLLLMLGIAPDPETAFKHMADRQAARDFARMMANAGAGATEAD